MKIIYFIDHLRQDGTQKVLNQLVAGFAKRGHYQAVVCLNGSWDEAGLRYLRENGAAVRIVGKLPILLGYGLFSLRKWLRVEGFEFAVTFLFVSDVIGRTLAKLSGIPCIISSIQNRDVNYAEWQHWMVRKTMRWVNAVHVCSHSLVDYAIEEGAKSKRIVVIPHSIDAEELRALVDNSKILQEFALSPEDMVIGSVGRLTYQKGYDVLLRALSLLENKHVHLLLVGTGEALESLKEEVYRNKLIGRVHFAGYRRDVPDLLAVMDVYVQPSRFEGMPLAVLEAMVAGRPIVASSVDGICELIEDGIHGWLVPPEDTNILAGAIDAALSDPYEAKRRGAAARMRAIENFNTEEMVNSWENMLFRQLE